MNFPAGPEYIYRGIRCHVEVQLRSTYVELVEFSYYPPMLLSVFEEASSGFRKQDLAYGIDDSIVVGMKVNRELAPIKFAGFAVTFI